jgi:hypothetical protein
VSTPDIASTTAQKIFTGCIIRSPSNIFAVLSDESFRASGAPKLGPGGTVQGFAEDYVADVVPKGLERKFIHRHRPPSS